MTERAILLDSLEQYLDKPPGSAAYEFADVSANALPPGHHELVGMINGTNIYLADPCLNFDTIPMDGSTGFSHGHFRLWNNEASGTTWKSHVDDFEGFDTDMLGHFIEENHQRMNSEEALEQSECYVLSSVESPAVAASHAALEMKSTL